MPRDSPNGSAKLRLIKATQAAELGGFFLLADICLAGYGHFKRERWRWRQKSGVLKKIMPLVLCLKRLRVYNTSMS
jgi:hypothetical protein